MNIGQLADLRCKPGAPLALLRRRVAGVPHEVVGYEHPASYDSSSSSLSSVCEPSSCIFRSASVMSSSSSQTSRLT
jgi:hypothetical protein